MVGERIQILYEQLNKSGIINSKREFCEILGIDYGNLAKYLTNKINLSINDLNYLNYKNLNINMDWLLTGEGEMFSPTSTAVAPVHAKIPLLRQRVSCGRGQSWEDVDAVEDYIEPLALIPSAKNAKIYAFRVRGTSMVGAGINDGDIILFDAKETDMLRDDLYVFALEGNVYCKLLKFDSIGRKISIYSVHTKELRDAKLLKTLDADKPETADTFHIFGRVFAWIQENRLMWR